MGHLVDYTMQGFDRSVVTMYSAQDWTAHMCSPALHNLLGWQVCGSPGVGNLDYYHRRFDLVCTSFEPPGADGKRNRTGKAVFVKLLSQLV